MNIRIFSRDCPCNHVTDWGKQPIKYRTDVAMMGKLGFDIVVDKLSEPDLKFCQQAVTTYNAISNVIWHGDLFRLADPQQNDFASLMYVNTAQDTAVMFNYLTVNRYGSGTLSPIRLSGLQGDKKYKVEEINLYPETKSALHSDAVYSGNYLMTVRPEPGAEHTPHQRDPEINGCKVIWGLKKLMAYAYAVAIRFLKVHFQNYFTK